MHPILCALSIHCLHQWSFTDQILFYVMHSIAGEIYLGGKKLRWYPTIHRQGKWIRELLKSSLSYRVWSSKAMPSLIFTPNLLGATVILSFNSTPRRQSIFRCSSVVALRVSHWKRRKRIRLDGALWPFDQRIMNDCRSCIRCGAMFVCKWAVPMQIIMETREWGESNPTRTK